MLLRQSFKKTTNFYFLSSIYVLIFQFIRNLWFAVAGDTLSRNLGMRLLVLPFLFHCSKKLRDSDLGDGSMFLVMFILIFGLSIAACGSGAEWQVVVYR